MTVDSVKTSCAMLLTESSFIGSGSSLPRSCFRDAHKPLHGNAYRTFPGVLKPRGCWAGNSRRTFRAERDRHLFALRTINSADAHAEHGEARMPQLNANE
eukprot:2678483-Rhodomonas_salina.1